MLSIKEAILYITAMAFGSAVYSLTTIRYDRLRGKRPEFGFIPYGNVKDNPLLPAGQVGLQMSMEPEDRYSPQDSYSANSAGRMSENPNLPLPEGSWSFYANHAFLSAHYDDRDNTINLLMHTLETKFHDFPRAYIWYEGYRDPCLVPRPYFLNMDGTMNGRFNRKAMLLKLYNPYILSDRIPVAVSLKTRGDSELPMYLRVRFSEKTLKKQWKFGICLAPLHGNVTAEQIANFVEMHRILGVTKFIVPSMNVSGKGRLLLSLYEREGLVDVFDWPMYKELDGTPAILHYYGQTTVYYRCMYEYLNQVTYMVFADLDEVIVPRGHGHMTLDNIVSLGHEDTAMWGILHQLFPQTTVVSERFINNTDVRALKMLPLMYTRRVDRVYPFTVRSKFIIKTDKIKYVKVHTATPVQGCATLVLNVSQAMVHHYRGTWKPDGHAFVEDSYMHKYAAPLIHNVMAVAQRLNAL